MTSDTGTPGADTGAPGAVGTAGASAAEGPAGGPGTVSAWRRPTAGEGRWPSVAAIAVAVVLQVVLPDRLVLHPRWLLPAVEVGLLVLLVVANPVRLRRDHPALRAAAYGLVAAMTAANTGSAVLLVDRLLTGRAGDDATVLIGSGAAIYATNIIAFALWYWELDRGGPFARAAGSRQHTDFLFPQMTEPDAADTEWEPAFLDYLYVSYTNTTAFSPTDTLPLSRWTKMLMLVQSAIALATIALVVARAINVLR